jgi:hypothetical protein
MKEKLENLEIRIVFHRVMGNAQHNHIIITNKYE